MALIKQGFYQVVNGTSGWRTETVGRKRSPSRKTGTVETTVDGGKQAINTNVAYAIPSNNPKIAVGGLPHNTNLQATVSHLRAFITNLYNQKHLMN